MSLRLAFVCLLASAPVLRAGEEERRTFVVTVDKKPAGNNEFVIVTRDDKTVVVTSQADVTVKVAFVKYSFTFRGSETWKDDRIQQFSTSTNDDGKKHAVVGEATKEGLAVKADGKEFQIGGQPWVTTYWRLPPENQRGMNVDLLEADTGKLIQAKLEKMGIEKVTALGKAVDCVHWRLSGGVTVDLWYDGTDRLVRQESLEDGHRMVLELIRLKRD